MRSYLVTVFSIAMIVPSILSARSDEVLTLDVRPVCRGIASQSADPLATGLQASFEECVKSEQDVREQLKQQWAAFSAADKQHCVTLAKTGGESSYTELLTCLEMARDVRALRSAAAAPSKRDITEQPASSPLKRPVQPAPAGKASQPSPAKEPSVTSPAKEPSVTESQMMKELERAKSEAESAKASEALAQRKLADAEAAIQRAKQETGRATAEAERAKADAKAARDTGAAARRDVSVAEAARVAAEGREQACQSAAAKAQSGFGARVRSWFGPRRPDVKNP
jgi:hypothetical protein